MLLHQRLLQRRLSDQIKSWHLYLVFLCCWHFSKDDVDDGANREDRMEYPTTLTVKNVLFLYNTFINPYLILNKYR